jgi:hypothetical protein
MIDSVPINDVMANNNVNDYVEVCDRMNGAGIIGP